ncbi:MAG: 50S ribosomal protein L25/general stress protein Ctc [Alphaproteobacteria bacterium]
MADHSMNAETRDRAGKGAARATRRAGRVPAVIYGGNEAPVLVSVDPRDVRKGLETGALLSHVYELNIGGKTQRVLARDVQLHPVTDAPEHVDFLRVTGATRVTVEVPCIFHNEETSPGLKRGGVLNVVRYAIEVTCAADAIPEHFDVDLGGLDIGDSVHISAVALPAGVRPTIARDFTIASVAAPSGGAEPAEGEGDAAAEG